MLGVPDAHHLPSSPGAAYLKTPSGELVRFQTAFVSGAYERPRLVQRPHAPVTPRRFTAAAAGRVIERPERTPDETGAPPRTLMDAVLNRLAGNGTPAHRVWLPPLRKSPTLDVLITDGAGEHPLSVPIGLVDSPYDQRRDVLIADLAGAAGNVAIVGAPQAGKSTALRTLVMAVAATHDPSVAQFYCLDFGGGALSSLRQVPHVGSVAGRSDADLCRRTVAEMEAVVRAREARFRRLGVESMTDYRRLRADARAAAAGDPFGDVFLVIDGWATLRQEFEGLEPRIIALAAQGLSYGVHVVVTASRWAEIRPALKDQIGTRIELRLGDPGDSEMDRRRARQLSHFPPGRGITCDGKEMVIALPQLGGEPMAARWAGRRARPIELLPLQVPHSTVPTGSGKTATQVVVGLGERELQPVALDFAEQAHLVVLGEGECGKTSTLRLICRELVDEYRRLGADRDRRLSQDAARRCRVRTPRRLRDVGRYADGACPSAGRAVAGADARRECDTTAVAQSLVVVRSRDLPRRRRLRPGRGHHRKPVDAAGGLPAPRQRPRTACHRGAPLGRCREGDVRSGSGAAARLGLDGFDDERQSR